MRRIGMLLPAAADDAEYQARVAAFLQGLQQSGWTDRPQLADRHPLGHGQCRRHPQARGGIGRARAGRHAGAWRLDRRGHATGDPHRADRVSGLRRSGRRRRRREPGAAGRQRHWIHVLRIQPEREMAGAAQADRAERDARGGASESRLRLGPRPVRRRPGRSPVAQGRREPGRRARRRRDRARCRGLCWRSEWRPDRDWRARWRTAIAS